MPIACPVKPRSRPPVSANDREEVSMQSLADGEHPPQNHSGTISGSSPIACRIRVCTYSGSIENSFSVS